MAPVVFCISVSTFYWDTLLVQVQRFRIFGLACNHTMDMITFYRQEYNLVCFFDHVFSKIFGEKWWCPWVHRIFSMEYKQMKLFQNIILDMTLRWNHVLHYLIHSWYWYIVRCESSAFFVFVFLLNWVHRIFSWKYKAGVTFLSVFFSMPQIYIVFGV